MLKIVEVADKYVYYKAFTRHRTTLLPLLPSRSSNNCNLKYNGYNRFISSNAVESLLLVGDECSWIGLSVPTNLRPDELKTIKYVLLQRASYLQNYVQTNQQRFDNPRTFAPTNQNDFLVLLNVNSIVTIVNKF